MNLHRLAITIESMEKQHERGMRVGQDEQFNYEKADSQQFQSEDEREYSAEEQQQSPSQECNEQNMYESVQTFGNHPNHKQFIDTLHHQTNSTKQPLRHHKISQLLAQSPLAPSNKRQRLHNLSESNVDDEVNRIVQKVLNQSKPVEWLRQSSYKREIEKISKIDKINKDLLNQNAQIIADINELEQKLQHKMSKLNKKGTKKNKKVEVSYSKDEKDGMKTLRSYKDRLAKALQLNSRLSSRLITERSRANVTGNTQRSTLTRLETNTQEMGAISTIQSQSLRNEKKGRIKKQQKMAVCERCCQEIKNYCSDERESFKRSPVFSPVLQFKNYCIQSSEKAHNLSEFQLSNKEVVSHSECQVSMEDQNIQLELLALDLQEKELERVVERNNNQIQQFQSSLFRLLDSTP